MIQFLGHKMYTKNSTPKGFITTINYNLVLIPTIQIGITYNKYSKELLASHILTNEKPINRKILSFRWLIWEFCIIKTS